MQMLLQMDLSAQQASNKALLLEPPGRPSLEEGLHHHFATAGHSLEAGPHHPLATSGQSAEGGPHHHFATAGQALEVQQKHPEPRAGASNNEVQGKRSEESNTESKPEARAEASSAGVMVPGTLAPPQGPPHDTSRCCRSNVKGEGSLSSAAFGGGRHTPNARADGGIGSRHGSVIAASAYATPVRGGVGISERVLATIEQLHAGGQPLEPGGWDADHAQTSDAGLLHPAEAGRTHTRDSGHPHTGDVRGYACSPQTPFTPLSSNSSTLPPAALPGQGSLFPGAPLAWPHAQEGLNEGETAPAPVDKGEATPATVDKGNATPATVDKGVVATVTAPKWGTTPTTVDKGETAPAGEAGVLTDSKTPLAMAAVAASAGVEELAAKRAQGMGQGQGSSSSSLQQGGELVELLGALSRQLQQEALLMTGEWLVHFRSAAAA